ncbi:cytochrome P450 [Caballeronia sp. AZ7_KS35]|uniref:cytochrome P450 n=1 Tax=Caballeronia sp. AZ7_KS35 TaxID=2921762 RepID=UPI0020282C42|nr:cytochrome P450 [Caballeronia sp. AZ7_KS35]
MNTKTETQTAVPAATAQTRSPSLVDPEIRRCPFDFYSGLRKHSPVAIMPGTDFYYVAEYDAAMSILLDMENYSNAFPAGETSFVNYCPEADKVLADKGFGRRVPTVVFSDPPLHTKFRKIVTEALRPSVVKAMEPKIRSVIQDLLDAISDGECDIVEAVLVPLPMYVLADWMGVDRDDYPKFKKWSLAANYTLQPPQPKEVLLKYAETIAEMQHYLVGMMKKRREAPREDLVTELLSVELGGERGLTDKEILSLLETLLVAGNETTTNAMGNGIFLLAKNPELQARLRADPSKVSSFIEEVLRIESSVTGVFRRAKNDVEVAGVKIPAGSKILVGIASANRDEKQFAHANQLDLDRERIRRHVAFGGGFHTCLGNQVARLEMQSFFEMFTKEFESVELAVPEQDVPYHDLMGLRGVSRLPLRLKRAK